MVQYLERLRFDGGNPLAIMRNWLLPYLTPLDRQGLESHGLYELLRGAGLHMCIAHQRIGGRLASTAEAKLLGVPNRSALLTMERVTFDESGRPFEFATHVYDANTYSFETTLVDQ